MTEEEESGAGRERRYPRVRKWRPVLVRRLDNGGSVAFGSLETVGRGGALLHCDQPLPDASDAEVAICLAGGVIRARARVLYHLPQEKGLGIGVEFLEISDDSADLLDHLVSSRGDDVQPDPVTDPDRWPFLLLDPRPRSQKPS